MAKTELDRKLSEAGIRVGKTSVRLMADGSWRGLLIYTRGNARRFVENFAENPVMALDGAWLVLAEREGLE